MYDPNNISILKNIMFIENNVTNKIYGKTGSGDASKAWFIGLKKTNNKQDYFAIYLDDKDKQDNVNGQKAKEIALKIIK